MGNGFDIKSTMS